jgi:ankyrin repeat protein
MFLNAGVEPKLLRTKFTKTALTDAICAENVSAVRYLLDNGVDLNVENGVLIYALFRMAALDGNSEIANIFLSMIDVDKDINSDNGSDMFRELIICTAAGGFDTFLQKWLEERRILHRSNNPKADNLIESVRTATYAASGRRQPSYLRIILDDEDCFIDDDLFNLLYSAKTGDKVETFSMLLERSALVDPPIEFASRLMLDILTDGKLDFARALMRYSDRLDLVGGMGSEFVFSMAAMGGVDAMQFALEQGAILDPDNEGQQKPMATAARMARPGVLKMFLDAAFDAHLVNNSSGTDDRGPTNALVDVIRAKDGDDAAKTADLPLDAGLDIEEPDQETDETPLLFMAGRPSRRISCRRRERAAGYLLEKGANMFYQSSQAQNPLVEAPVNGNTGIVRIMLEYLDVTCVPLEISRPFVLSAMGMTTYRDVLKVLSHWYWPKVYPCPP